MNLAFGTTLNQPMIWNPKPKGINYCKYVGQNPDLCLRIFSLHLKMAYYLILTYSLEFLFSCRE